MAWQRRRRSYFFWIALAAALMIVLVIGMWQLFSFFQVSISDVRDMVKDSPLGKIAGIVTDWPVPAVTDNGTSSWPVWTGSWSVWTGDEGTGSGPEGSEDEGTQPESGGGGSPPPEKILTVGPGNIIWINTDITYGVVFPGEILTDYFTVHLVGTTSATYTVNMTLAGDMDMRPYLLVMRDPAEDPEGEPDSTANGTISDYWANGSLTYSSDNSDKWLVTFYVPDVVGIYQANIEIVPTDNTTVTKD